MIIAAIIALIFIGTFMFLWQKSQPQEVVYNEFTPEMNEVKKTTIITGKIEPRNEVNVKPQIGGIITDLYKEPGDYVQAGDVIAKVKVIPDMGQLSSAEARVRLAGLNLKQAQVDYEREKSLYDQQLVSADEYDKVRQKMDQAKEELAASQDNLQVVRDGVSKSNASASSTLIRATISGIILDVPVKVGNSVINSNTFNDGTTIASVANMKDLIFRGNIDETEVGQLYNGIPMKITVGALQDLKLDANLEYISPKAVENNGANQFEIKAAVKVTDNDKLRSGYSANAEIVLSSVQMALTIPESAIEFSNDSTFVYVVKGKGSKKEYERRAVVTGLSDGVNIEIKKGVSLVCLVPLDLHAQQHEWTLRECTDYAVCNNLTVKQKDNTRRKQELQLSTARNRRLPDLGANVGETFSFGRGLTMDNTYTNRNTSSTTFSMTTQVPLFTGFEIPNNIKLNQLRLEAAIEDLEKAKNDIRMQVAKAYVQILYDMELADVAWRQVSIDSMQVVRLESFFHNGKASGAEVAQQKATHAQSILTATQADNNLQLALLALTQLLELPTPEGFMVVRPTSPFSALVLPNPEVVFAEAMVFKPEVRAEQLRLDASEKSIKVAQAARYPRLTLNGGLQSNYYKTSGMAAASFGSQLKNNFSQYIGLSLNIPIFNRFATRNSIRSAEIDRETQQLQLDNVKKTLYKEIQQV